MRLFTEGLENSNVRRESDVYVYLRKVSGTVMSGVKAMCAFIYRRSREQLCQVLQRYVCLFTEGIENSNVRRESDVFVYLRKVSRTVMSGVKAMCASIYGMSREQ